MKIISFIQHLIFVGFLNFKGLDATENMKLRLKTGHQVLGGYTYMPPIIERGPPPDFIPHVVRPQLPDWMKTRPEAIVTATIFMIDNSGNYYQGAFGGIRTENGGYEPISRGALADSVIIKFLIQTGKATDFRRSKRPNPTSLRRRSRNVPPPTINEVYIMMMSGKIYKSPMSYHNPRQTNQHAVGIPVVHGNVYGAPAGHPQNAHY